jgi:hypothetical protein
MLRFNFCSPSCVTIKIASFLRGRFSRNLFFVAMLLAISAGTSFAQTAGVNWVSRTSPADVDWRGITFGNNTFVAVASSGGLNRVMTSTDGVTWTSRNAAASNQWRDVTYGNPQGTSGLFVAVSDDGNFNRVMTSPDGINWTSRSTPVNNQWYSVTYGNGLFVAVALDGAGNRVMTSPDGITWTARTSAANNQWYSVTFGNGLFVAVSYDGFGNRVMTSPDGINWTSRNAAAENQWVSVTHGNGLFVAVSFSGNGNRVMTSPDGINWTARASTANNLWYDVAYGAGLFTAVSWDGNNNRVMTSPDGVTWTARNAAAELNWRALAFGNGMYAAVSLSGTGNRVMTSGTYTLPVSPLTVSGSFTPQNKTYDATTRATVSFSNLTLNGISSGDVVVIDSVRYAFSDANAGTGKTVTIQQVFLGGVNASKYTLSLTGAPTATATINRAPLTVTANNGTAEVSATPFASDFGVSYSGFVGGQTASVLSGTLTFTGTAIGATTPGTYTITPAGLTSSNYDISFVSGTVTLTMIPPGAEWTQLTGIPDRNWSSIVYGNGRFVTVSNAVLTSTDGANWTLVSGTPSRTWEGVTYGNGQFLAISSAQKMLSSPDGLVWTEYDYVAPNSTFDFPNRIGFGGGMFVMVTASANGHKIWSSPDGVNWTQRMNTGIGQWHSIAYGGGRFVAVSLNRNVVATSLDGINWTTSTPSSDRTWLSVTYGKPQSSNGLFVAVAGASNQTPGREGRVMTSPDGITWTARNAASDERWETVGYGNGMFVALGLSSEVMTSPDGINWTARPGKTGWWTSIAYGAGQFVAVGQMGSGNRIMTSGTHTPDPVLSLTGSFSVADKAYDGTTRATITSNTLAISGVIEGDAVTLDSVRVAFTNASGGTGKSVTIQQLYLSGKDVEKYVINRESFPAATAAITRIPLRVIAKSGTAFTGSAFSGGFGVFYQGFIPGESEANLSGTLSYTGSAQGKSAAGQYKVVPAGLTSANYEISFFPATVLITNTMPGTTWSTRTPARNIPWNSVAYGNGLFAAVGVSSDNDFTIMTSPDGATWTGRSHSDFNYYNFTSITYGGGKFVAVNAETIFNRGRVLVSTDGVRWDLYPDAQNAVWRSVTFGGGAYVAVGENANGGVIMSSANGTEWTLRSAPSSSLWKSVTYADGKFVAVASSGTGSRVITSPDGITWTAQTASVDRSWQSVTYGNGLFAAVASSGVTTSIMTSPDAITWTTRTAPNNNNWTSVSFGNGIFTAVSNTGSGNRVMTSTDGLTWTARSSASDNEWNSVAYGNGRFVAVGQTANGSQVMTSGDIVRNPVSVAGSFTVLDKPYDGTVSARVASSNLTLSGADPDADVKLDSVKVVFANATAGSGKTVSIDFLYLSGADAGSYGITPGNGPTTTAGITKVSLTVTAKDGTVWTNPASPFTGGFGVTYSGFVAGETESVLGGTLSYAGTSQGATAVGTYSIIPQGLTSPNYDFVYQNGALTITPVPAGVNWVSTTAPVDSRRAIAYGDGLFVTGGFGFVETSTDGVTWTKQTIAGNDGWYSIAYGNGQFVAVATSSTRVMTSPDGINWTIRTGAVNSNWTSLTYGKPEGSNGLFVAVANLGTGGQVMTSPDGITWTVRTAAATNQWSSVTFGKPAGTGGLFVAVAATGGGIMTSPDGIIWTSRTAPEALQWQSVTYGNPQGTNGLFVAVSGSTTSTPNGVITSPDGITWTSRKAASAKLWRSVAYGGGFFVATAYDGTGDQAMTSPDGINWTTRSTPGSGSWWGLAYGPDMFVSIGISSGIMTSGAVVPTLRIAGNFSVDSKTYDGTTTATLLSSNLSLTGLKEGDAVVLDSVRVRFETATAGAEKTVRITEAFASGANRADYLVSVFGSLVATAAIAKAPLTITAISGEEYAFETPFTGGFGVTYSGFVAGENESVLTGTLSYQGASQGAIGVGEYAIIPAGLSAQNYDIIPVNGILKIVPIAPGIVWRGANASRAASWTSVTRGKGLYVAVSLNGTGNRVMTSPDGIAWTTRTSSHDSFWSAVTYGTPEGTGGLYVAVGTATGDAPRVMTSPDGITWTSISGLTRDLGAVVFANNQFVAVGQNTIATSPDGITWTEKTSPLNVGWNGITWGRPEGTNGLFVAVASNHVMTSPDGENWTSRAIPGNSLWYGVAFGNGKFVAVAASSNTNRVMTSLDGENWTYQKAAVDNAWTSVAFGKPEGTSGLFVAVSATNNRSGVMTSPDGITWKTRPSVNNNDWRSVTFGAGQFVAIASSAPNGQQVMVSGNFMPEQLLTLAGSFSTADKVYDGTSRAAIINGSFTLQGIEDGDDVAIDSVYAAFSNRNAGFNKTVTIERVTLKGADAGKYGVNTSAIPAQTASIQKAPLIITAKSGRVSPGSQPFSGGFGVRYAGLSAGDDSTFFSGSIVYSGFSQGATSIGEYPIIPSGLSSLNYNITYSPGTLFIMDSAGIDWVSQTTTGTGAYNAVAYGNGVFVAYGGNGVMTSPDGVTWTPRAFPANGFGTGITFGNGVFVALNYENSVGKVFTSTDGITWTERRAAAPHYWYSVAYGNGQFVAVAFTRTGTGVMTSPDGINWTSRNGAVENSWLSVAYGNGQFVAVGGAFGIPNIMTSADGIVWTTPDPASTGRWSAVTFGDGQFVVVGSNGAATSPDGKRWTSRTIPANNTWVNVTYGQGLFVAIAGLKTGQLIMTSPDGITWTTRTAPAVNDWRGITYARGLFVGVSWDGTNNRVMTSGTFIPAKPVSVAGTFTVADKQYDGTVRARANQLNLSLNGFDSGDIVSIDSARVRFADANAGTEKSVFLETVHLGGPNAFKYAADLANAPTSTGVITKAPLTATARSGTAVAPAIGFSGGFGVRYTGFVPGDDSTKIGGTLTYTGTSQGANRPGTYTIFPAGLTSPNYDITYAAGTVTLTKNPPGNEWVIRTSANDNQWLSVAYGNGMFVAVAGSGTNRIMTSPDGINWTARPSADENNGWRSVVYGGGQFVAVAWTGSAKRVMTSPDGITWTARPSADENNGWRSVVYGGGQFVAVAWTGSAKRVMTSPDGINWTAQTDNLFGTWESVTYGNPQGTGGLYVAVGSSGSGSRVMTSPDGITWTGRTASAQLSWGSVAYGNGLFVAVAYSGSGVNTMTSADGITWTDANVPVNQPFNAITYANGQFVAVGANRISTSPDGITWTNRTSPADLGYQSVTYGSGLYVAVATYGFGLGLNQRVATSADGVTWTLRPTPVSNQWNAVTYGNELFVAVSRSGTGNRVMTSGVFVPDPINLSLSGSFTAAGKTYDGTTAATFAENNLTLSGLREGHTVTIDSVKISFESAGAGAKKRVSIDTVYIGGADLDKYTFNLNNAPFDSAAIALAPLSITAKDGTAFASANGFTGGFGVTYSGFVANEDSTVLTGSIQYGGSSQGATAIGEYEIMPDGLSAANYNITFVAGKLTLLKNPPGNEWTLRESPVTTDWRSVTYGNRTWVAVGNSGSGNRVMTSPDGVNWKQSPATDDIYSWSTVTYGKPEGTGGLFVAMSVNANTNNIMTSPDGVNWTTQRSPVSRPWFDVTYGGGRFVAIASSQFPNVLSSPDGINWTAANATGEIWWTSVTYGNGMFVAVALTGEDDRVMRSTDGGLTWTAGSNIPRELWNAVAYENGRFVAVGNNAIMTSPDGINWTRRASPANKNWTSLTYGNGRWVAVANTGSIEADFIMVSEDAETWELRASPATSHWRDVHFRNGMFVAVASNGQTGRVMTSGTFTPDPFTTSIAATPGWRLLSSPAPTTYADFLEEAWTSGSLNADVRNGQANVYTYEDSLLIALFDMNFSINPGTGFAYNHLNDDDFDQTPNTQPTVFSISGFEHASPVSPRLSAGNNRYTLLGNPFDAALNWNAVSATAAGLTKTAYTWDPETNRYRTWNGEIGSLENGIIAPFTGFWVQNDAASTQRNIAFTKSATGSFQPPAKQNAPVYFELEASLGNNASSTFVQFSADGRLTRDDRDAVKLQPFSLSFAALFTLPEAQAALDINHLPLISEITEIPLAFEATQNGQVQLALKTSMLPPEWTISIRDTKTGTVHPMEAGGRFTFDYDNAITGLGENTLNTIELQPSADPRFVLTVNPGVNTANETAKLPTAVALSQNFPNPFNPTTQIAFALPSASHVKLTVFDLTGRAVSVLFDGNKPAGFHQLPWDASRQASGVYFLRMETAGKVLTRKMTLLK